LHYSANELPGLTYIRFSGLQTRLFEVFPVMAGDVLQDAVTHYHIVREHSELKKIVLGNSIDIVISDNRFGLWNKDATTVYVTHMLAGAFSKAIPLCGDNRDSKSTGR